MTKHVLLEDITIRDGAQCLWATRLSTDEIIPVASTMDRAGFQIIDVTGGAAIDTSIMYLREDPFERTRVLKQLMPRTPLNFNSRGQSVFRWTQYPDDVAELTIKTFAKNGIGSIMLFDPLNDMRNVAYSAQVAKSLGLHIIGSITYTISPYHTDHHFINKARELVDLGVDAISLKDPSGLLTPDRAVSLVKGMRSVLNGQKLQLHCHTSTGTGPEVHQAAMDLGTEAPDVFHGAAPPLAWGTSHPSHQFLLEQLQERGFTVDVDSACVQEMTSYFTMLAERRGLPTSHAVPNDPAMFEHQVPGGMMSNLVRMLDEQGMKHRLPEVLDEVSRVRQDLGYPIPVSPMAQYLGTQAVLNVVTGQRYQVVPDEIRNYLYGYYGSPPGPVDDKLLDQVLGDDEPITERPGDVLEPMVEDFRDRNGPFDSDERLALAIFYSQPVLRQWNLADWQGYRATPTNPLSYLVDTVAKDPRIAEFDYRNKRVPMKLQYRAS